MRIPLDAGEAGSVERCLQRKRSYIKRCVKPKGLQRHPERPKRGFRVLTAIDVALQRPKRSQEIPRVA